MNYALMPQEFRDCVDKAVEEHTNTEDQIACARSRVRGLSIFQDLVQLLVDDAIQEYVYAVRHTQNRKIRRESGYYGQVSRPKGVEQMRAINDAYARYYDFNVSGKRLGDIRGEELERLSSVEVAIADTHQAKAKLFKRLSEIVRPERTVRECVAGPKLQKMFEDVGL